MSFLEDVYTYNDFVHTGDNQGVDKKSDVTPDTSRGYLVSEYMGHMFPTKPFDWEEKRLEDAMRHAKVLNDVATNTDIAGSFGWCMFDYNTHKDFGSGDRVCYHGVTDMFRNPKMAAYVYAEMQDDTPFLQISSSMDIGEHPGCNRNETYIFTNADSVKMYKNDRFIKEYKHENKELPFLKNAPIKIDDYIGDALKDEKMTPSQEKDVKIILNEVAKFGLYQMTTGSKLKVLKEIESYDVACVRIHAVDENGNILYYYNDPVLLKLEGDAELIGPKVIGLSGGMGGTYVKSIGKAGKATLTVCDANGTELCELDFKIQLEP